MNALQAAGAVAAMETLSKGVWSRCLNSAVGSVKAAAADPETKKHWRLSLPEQQ